MLTLSSDMRAINATLNGLPTRLRTAISRSINRTLESTTVFMVGRLQAATGIPATVVASKLNTTRATTATLEGELTARTRAGNKLIPILQLRARQVGKGPNVPGGVTFIFDGVTKTIPDAFIARMPSGHRGVFSRVGKQRLPIFEQPGPSWRTLFGREEAAGLAYADRELATNLEAELKTVAASV